MAITISKLAVILSARTAKFEKSLQKAGGKTAAFGKKVGKIGLVAAAAFALIGVAAVRAAKRMADAFGRMVQAQFGLVDTLAKTSDRLNAGIEGLVALRLAGKRAGVEVRTLDMALQRMTRRVSEAAMGTGEAQGAIRELGLDAKRLSVLRLEDQFKAIVEAWGGVAARDKVRLAFKLFDSEGVKLLNLMNAGSAALEEANIKARLFGLTLSRTEAGAIEDMNDAFSDMQDAIAGLARQIAVKLAPALEQLFTFTSNKLAEFTTTLDFLLIKLARMVGLVGRLTGNPAMIAVGQAAEHALPRNPFAKSPGGVGGGGVVGPSGTNEAVSLLRQILDKEGKLLDSVTMQAGSLNTLMMDARHKRYHGGVVRFGPLQLNTLVP